MFDSEIYVQRRKKLKKQIGDGIVLVLGNDESPMNYPANPYHFRQDSTFLYFFGLDSPGLAGIVDIEEGTDTIFGDDIDVEDIIWMGDLPKLTDRAKRVGVTECAPSGRLAEIVNKAIQRGRKVHYLPPYRADTSIKLGQLLGIKQPGIKNYSSFPLIKAVVDQRSIKIREEIDEIEKALDVTYKMHTTAMKMAKDGVLESEIAGTIEGIALAAGGAVSFPVILSINGQILHNHYHGNRLQKGRLLVNDSGAETASRYASDITRTMPVGGKFTEKQKEIYSIVLSAVETAIKSVKPGKKNKEVHIAAAHCITDGLTEAGLMTGNTEEAVKAGAHALFFPHGLGHMMGLDVHDMENLGENFVGYDDKNGRSEQFGLAYLRLARELKPNFVMTIEPGIYFIPALIDKWKSENKLEQFIDYKKVEEYRDFGGIRIEDDIVVTEDGCRVLGKPIPKTIEDLEAITATGV